MTRLLKALGIAMSAIAVFAVMASAAQAETGALTATEYPAIVTGQQGPGGTFDIGARNVECATSDLNGTLVGPTDPVTLKPIYANCISQPGALPVTITPNGCDYLFGVSKPGTTGVESATTGRLQAWLNCPPGQQLEIHIYENVNKHAANVSTCTYDVPSQGPVPAGIYHNVAGGPGDVLATVNATFNALSTIGPPAFCGANAFEPIPVQLTGNYTLKGFQDFGGMEGMQIPIWVD
ncbi:MAG TPA: hypothetical protein VGW80_00560 [Solirubrobacterales bacterium]|jgi:hypothetical protein|nr:hypothetical protein [Solirubrobacterales bacterium]